MTPRQQRQLVQRSVQRVEYDAVTGEWTVRMRGLETRQRTAKVRFCTGNDDRKAVCTKAAEEALPVAERVPRVARLMALAIRFEQLVRDDKVIDYAELARAGHVTRARLSQIMSLALLAPDIQEAQLLLPETETGPDPITERHLRRLAAEPDWARPRQLWSRLHASLLNGTGNPRNGRE